MGGWVGWGAEGHIVWHTPSPGWTGPAAYASTRWPGPSSCRAGTATARIVSTSGPARRRPSTAAAPSAPSAAPMRPRRSVGPHSALFQTDTSHIVWYPRTARRLPLAPPQAGPVRCRPPAWSQACACGCWRRWRWCTHPPRDGLDLQHMPRHAGRARRLAVRAQLLRALFQPVGPRVDGRARRQRQVPHLPRRRARDARWGHTARSFRRKLTKVDQS